MGKRDECLQICWSLRLEPELSLYRRALVNLLIATIADVRDHHDLDKFAQECIDLIDQVRRNGIYSSETTLTTIQDHARNTLIQIEELKADLDVKGDESSQFADDVVPEHRMRRTEAERTVLNSLGGVASSSSGRLMSPEADESEKLAPSSAWKIEGMYTDHGSGARKEGSQADDDDDDFLPTVEFQDDPQPSKQSDDVDSEASKQTDDEDTIMSGLALHPKSKHEALRHL